MKSNISIIFLLFCITSRLFPQKDLNIVSSDFRSIVIEYTASYDTSKIRIDNNEFIRIDLENGFVPDTLNWGEAAVPERSLNIGVPSGLGNTIEVLNSAYKELSGKIIPVGKPTIDKGMLVPNTQ
jgi:hypothetical protein